MKEATKAPKVSFYDYIVIGGGTTGIPLATTLSTNYSVLLLERGGSPYGNPNITQVMNFGSYFLDTSPNSPSQRFSSEGVINARPRVLGGGTSINAGFYSRGEPKFNKEARLMDKRLIRESYEWAEKVMVSKPEPKKWQSAFRAALVEAGVKPDNGFTYDHIAGLNWLVRFLMNMGRDIPLQICYNMQILKGCLFFYMQLLKKSYLRPKVGKSRPLAYGVAFKDSFGNKHKAYLKGGKKNEVILSAGALGSPQLLMLSGIGPKEQLDAHKIKIVLEQPFVGKDMADNPMNTIFIPSPVVVEATIVQLVGITRFGSLREIFYIEWRGVYLLVTVAAFPNLDDKIESISLKNKATPQRKHLKNDVKGNHFLDGYSPGTLCSRKPGISRNAYGYRLPEMYNRETCFYNLSNLIQLVLES
ncbi:putative glucose-methanol-choline oxidoreductase, FAD/NAD(P)-binding domain superfamily [Helianthus annuus]|nr:putative glucose-methanol-choline oxidoreductase, FAD/NAD(P)-binding domain superfamily [Helianthus annuus]